MGIITRDSVKELVATSKEVIEILGISRARLSQLAKNKKLTPIKKNLYMIEDVLSRKASQDSLRKKYYRPKDRTK